MNGASGATVTIDREKGIVTKSHPLRPELIRTQGRFMRLVGSQIFPRVFVIRDYSYDMEILHPLLVFPANVLLGSMRHNLSRMWRNMNIVQAGSVLGIEHETYVAVRSGEYSPVMSAWLNKIRWYNATHVDRTHGDPTIENVMLTDTGSLRFIDPLPCTKEMPSLKAVDYGKMLQSCWGYEDVRGNLVNFKRSEANETAKIVLRWLDPIEAELATYFLCVHILRLIPYQPEDLKMTFWDMFRSALSAYGPQ